MLSGFNWYFISRCTVDVARAVERSQFDEKRALWIDTLSVWPSIRMLLPLYRKMFANYTKTIVELALIWSEPMSKKPTSHKLMTKPSLEVHTTTSPLAI